MLRKLLLVFALLLPGAAQAEWREASSERFLVYSEGSEANLRDFTEKLEKFDYLLRVVSNTKAPPSPIKLKIYLMDNFAGVQKTLPYEAVGIAGYYSASSRGPIAVGVSGSTRAKGKLNPQSVLLHEYAHHFMFQYFPASYPSWYSEGFAEYYGQTEILKKDVMEVGHIAEHRYGSFYGNRWLPLRKMLAARSYSDVPEIDLLYAQGWLLVHYLAQKKERAGQLEKYLNLINAGQSYEQAMNAAFGEDAAKLDDELRTYSGKVKHDVTVLPFKTIQLRPITIRALSPAEKALIWQEIALGRGILKSEASGFAADVRRIAARYPDDPYALSLLIEAERAAGNNAAAMSAVDQLLAIRPDDTRALTHKGQLQMAALMEAKSADKAAWEAARAYIIKANRTNPNDAFVLEAYYDSFAAQGVPAPPAAQNALFRAHELVPQDADLRYKVALDFERRNMIEDALAVIKPSAFQLHNDEQDPKKKKKQEEQAEKYREVGKEKRESAREMFDRLEKKLAAAKAASPAGG